MTKPHTPSFNGLPGPMSKSPEAWSSQGLGPTSSGEAASSGAGFWEVKFISSLMTVYKLKIVCLARSLPAVGPAWASRSEGHPEPQPEWIKMRGPRAAQGLTSG